MHQLAGSTHECEAHMLCVAAALLHWRVRSDLLQQHVRCFWMVIGMTPCCSAYSV